MYELIPDTDLRHRQCSASAKIFEMMNQYISIGTNNLSGKLIRP